MSRLVTDAELVMRDHVVSKSLSPYWRRVEMGLPLYRCGCGNWSGELYGYAEHLGDVAREKAKSLGLRRDA